jgi:hypothetical protein
MANKTPSADLPDSEKDKQELQPDKAILDLPDVKDIPGQEHIHVPHLREMADTTISSDDEENIPGDDNDELDITDDSDVTPGEVEALERSAENMDTEDNENLYRSELDNTDLEGEKLNEEINVSGDDLDIPGAEEDDADEEIGEEDEENNAYSLGDTE